MTVSTTISSLTFPGNGVTQIFPCDFRIFDETDVRVSLVDQTTGADTPLILNTHYTISGAGDDAGFMVATLSPVASGVNLYVRRALAYTQPTDFTNQGAFFPTMHEDAMDRLSMQIQQLADENDRAIRLPAGLSDINGQVPELTPLAPLVINADGTGVEAGSTALTGDMLLRGNLAATGDGKGGTLVGFIQRGANAVARKAQDKSREVVSILDFGGKDDGTTDNAVPFSNAKVALGGSGRVLLPLTSTGTYYFSVAPDVSGVTIDPDEGVTLLGAFPIGSTVKTRRDLKVHISAQNFDYHLTGQYAKPWADKTMFLTDGDIDRGTLTSVSTAGLSHEKQVWVGDTWAAATGEYTLGTDSVTWNAIGADSNARVSSCTIKPGEELMVAFPTTGAYRRIAVIRTTTATYFVTADGGNAQPMFGNKAIGGSTNQNAFSYNGRSSHASYYPENCTWSIKVYDRNHFGVFFNGVEVTNIQSTAGDIVRAGFGVQSLSGSLTASVVGWSKFVNKPIGGKQGINLLCIGDSLTADIHGGWPYAIREALDLSFGIRVNSVTNQAISGSNVNAQLGILQGTGTGSASHAFICLGTNDIQFATNTASFLSDLGTMIDTLTSAFCTPIVWIPPLWYLQANGTGGGQTTQNYEIGAEKRARIARLCADKSVKCVDMMQVSGAVLGTYLTAGNGLDPVVRDNIHPTSYFYRQIAFRLARALAGAYSLPITQSKIVTTFPSSAPQNSWTNGGNAAYAIDSDGFVTLSGYLSPGTLTDGTTVLLLPEHVRPAATGRFIVSKGGASVALAQVGTDGTVAIYGGSGASYLALDGVTYRAA